MNNMTAVWSCINLKLNCNSYNYYGINFTFIFMYFTLLRR